MELDRKVRWKNLRDELYVKIAGDPHSLDNKDDITTSEFPVNDVEISNLGFPIVYSSM